MNAPTKSRDALRTDEAAAVRLVVEAESVWLFAQATGTEDDIAKAKTALDTSRVNALAVRQTMQEGLDALTRYAAYQEAVAHAAANGLTVPPTTV